ncbi:hypothetical protein [Anaerosporobacter sp.]
MKAEMIFHEQGFEVIMIERENLITKKEINHELLGMDDAYLNYHCCFEVKEYRLYLRECEIVCAHGYQAVLQVNKKDIETTQLMVPNTYSGSMLIARGLITTEHRKHGKQIPCYNYEEVIELIFSQGILLTTINHSRAMKRVRMNLEGGYRTLSKKKDVRCIEKFLRDCFVGMYRERLV